MLQCNGKSVYLCRVLIKQIIVLRFKNKKNEKVSFNVRCYCSSFFGIMW